MKKTALTIFAYFAWLPSLAFSHEPQVTKSADLRKIAVGYDQDCKWKAKTVKWATPEQGPVADSFQFEVNGFIINIPGGVKRFMVSVDGYVTVIYPDKSILSFEARFIPDNIRPSILGQPETEISHAKMADTLFMKTHCDKPPANELVALVWNSTLVQKLGYFEDAKNVTKTDSGKLTYYLSDNAAPPVMSGRAVITNNRLDHKILVMSAYHMPFDKFKHVVFNIIPLEN